jgi:hypothetical protein
VKGFALHVLVAAVSALELAFVAATGSVVLPPKLLSCIRKAVKKNRNWFSAWVLRETHLVPCQVSMPAFWHSTPPSWTANQPPAAANEPPAAFLHPQGSKKNRNWFSAWVLRETHLVACHIPVPAAV